MGKEFSGKGANVQFGPGANLARLPNGGRSFEYISGEDPFLGFTLIQPVVKGIQGQGVIANAKHVRANFLIHTLASTVSNAPSPARSHVVPRI